MRGTLIDSTTLGQPQGETRSRSLTLTAFLCALLVTGLLFAGYAYLRKRHAQQTLAAANAEQKSSAPSRGPIKAQVLVDEAILKGDQTIVGGTVKNVSADDLMGLSVDLEMKRRKDGGADKISAPVEPSYLAPQQEGRYSIQLRSSDYSSVKVTALKAGSDSAPVAFTTLPGQKRPPEKTENKTIVVSRPPPAKGGFLNTPNNPGRVP